MDIGWDLTLSRLGWRPKFEKTGENIGSMPETLPVSVEGRAAGLGVEMGAKGRAALGDRPMETNERRGDGRDAEW